MNGEYQISLQGSHTYLLPHVHGMIQMGNNMKKSILESGCSYLL